MFGSEGDVKMGVQNLGNSSTKTAYFRLAVDDVSKRDIDKRKADNKLRSMPDILSECDELGSQTAEIWL